jgi:hypothetical protein
MGGQLLPSLPECCCHHRKANPKEENNVLDKTHHLLGADFSQGSCLDSLSEFVDRNKQVG